MANDEIQIHELNSATGLSDSDYFVIDTGTATMKVPNSAVQNALKAIVADLGAVIPSGADLNTYTSVGTYHSPSAAVSGSLSNTPITGLGFKLAVLRTGYASTYMMQLAFYGGAQPRIYARTNSAGTWSDWYEITKYWLGSGDIGALDDVKKTGIYTFPSTATGKPAAMGNSGGALLVLQGTGTNVHQIVYRDSTAHVINTYHRIFNGSAWSEWFMEDATGKSIYSGELLTTNIDDLAVNNIVGAVWMNCALTSITGTKPYASGQGILYTLRQSSDITRQVYFPITAVNYRPRFRYYTKSTATWTAWEDATLVGTVKAKTYTFTDSTSGGGGTGIVKEISISSLGGIPVSAVATAGTSSNLRMVSCAFDTNRNVMRVTADNMTGNPASFTITVYYV